MGELGLPKNKKRNNSPKLPEHKQFQIQPRHQPRCKVLPNPRNQNIKKAKPQNNQMTIIRIDRKKCNITTALSGTNRKSGFCNDKPFHIQRGNRHNFLKILRKYSFKFH